ncbi:single-stranded-DNA-specific exonuclease RecJ [Leptolyngbya sp. O-77]|uniref:single-stranded-DNA-specific exonuclease RecJ n=1 Tax=Leptolyngbya sp. O-77 TaxID=1080068 RepID=UPI00074D3967|nr:single-stranded-DNA-specific exonuclease RecJ [Leptolyngbya sp. O-77]BAU45013.1 Single-stranded-DNA-specific exonuclease RecJ [Leptolyngbya sp. O-77]
MAESAIWQLPPDESPPAEFVQAAAEYAPDGMATYAAQLLWQRGIRDSAALAGWLDPNCYAPTSPFAFGEEMQRAIARLKLAYERQEAIAIWGDFDADGITATAVLWEGLGQFFPQGDRLSYVIPNRLTESHGLTHSGIEQLAAAGVRLIVTCDTGSTSLAEIDHANRLGLDVIVTDHHTLLTQRPPVVAIVNPRSLPADHPLATLSGVAVAYKLVEALYETLPDVPTRPLDALLDLVAIGLIADLVELRGDCRYLAQRGIAQLQKNQDVATAPRPGVAMLLEFCKKAGDRPTDISFGLGPRINAISRIQGDARDGVELLTSRDESRCRQLAEAAELANTRRRALQQDLFKQVSARLSQMDLSTTGVIVLEDPQWPVGVLGLVAGQIAQEYGRPTLLLSSAAPLAASKPAASDASKSSPSSVKLARGSARSVNQIDLYDLMSSQQHLLSGFGGHPLAAGLSLPVENIPLFADGINRQLRQQVGISGAIAPPALPVDLIVTVGQLGKDLFQALKLLEPCGMGNPTPNLLIRQCRFENVRNENIRDFKQRKVRYIKTEFELVDETGQFPGVWWGHYRDEMPPGPCDAVVQMDFNPFRKRYEVRLMAVRPAAGEWAAAMPAEPDWLLDWRGQSELLAGAADAENVLVMTDCPTQWDDLRVWGRQARHDGKRLAIAYQLPPAIDPLESWQTLVGLAKYLSRTGQVATRSQLLRKLGLGDRPLRAGIQALQVLGMTVTALPNGLQFQWNPADLSTQSPTAAQVNQTIEAFLSAVEEEQFRRQYFATVPAATIRAIAA